MNSRFRGQLGIEFFLIVAFILVIGATLSASTDSEVINLRGLDRAALSKSVSDAVAHSVNLVIIQGNGSSISRELFFPQETPCLQYSATRNAVYCSVPGVGNVYSIQMLSEPHIDPACYTRGTAGWMLLKIQMGSNNVALVNCTKVS